MLRSGRATAVNISPVAQQKTWVVDLLMSEPHFSMVPAVVAWDVKRLQHTVLHLHHRAVQAAVCLHTCASPVTATAVSLSAVLPVKVVWLMLTCMHHSHIQGAHILTYRVYTSGVQRILNV